ncbi:MAG: sulfatase [Acidobacteriota bacterium]|nr:sulfatase [Acidobacteriota bacterium]
MPKTLRSCGLVLFLVATLGCTGGIPDLDGGYQGHNVLLISVDTLRADRLGCYGYERPTPVLDALAEQSYVFESMFTTSSTTFPAHVSLMTGLHPKDLRNGFFLTESATTLAEILEQTGYQTLAVVSSLPLDSRFGLDQGFARYESDFSDCHGTSSGQKWYAVHDYDVFECSAAETTQRVLTKIDEVPPDGPFFLWVHYFDPHLPYTPPEGTYDPGLVSRTDFPFFHEATDEDLDSLNALYDGEVQFVDQQIGVLLDELESRGLREDTIIAIVGDHGENLYQHDGFLGHSRVVYDTVMRIPGILHVPGRPGARVEGLTDITDVMPTLLGLLGIPGAGLEGENLVGALASEDPVTSRPYVACETNDFLMKDPDQTIAIRTRQAKYIMNNWNRKGHTFFDLVSDPDETQPLQHPPAAQSELLRTHYTDWKERLKIGQLASGADLDEATLEAFRALGYLQ